MQWAWAIFLFVSPYYGQPECSGGTVVVMFLTPFRARDINSFDGNGLRFLVWPTWLLFCVGVTLSLTVILAVSSAFRATEEFSRPSASVGGGTTPATPVPLAWAHMVMDSLPPWRDRRRQFVFWCNCLSFVVWGMFVAGACARPTVRSPNTDPACSVQPRSGRRSRTASSPGRIISVASGRCVEPAVLPGPADCADTPTPQITAVFVSLVPLWSLAVALYKYPSLRRHRKRHEQQAQRQPHGGTSRAASVVAPVRRPYGHTLHPSDASEGYEMQSFVDSLRGHTYSPVSSSAPS